MKLYDVGFSPYATRVRLAIRLKRLPVAIEAPPGGLRTAEYRRHSPTGKVPCLVLDDGSALPESVAILEYFEDAFPAPPLRPAEALARARMRAVVQITDHALGPAVFALFGRLRQPPDPAFDPAPQLAATLDPLTQIATIAAGEPWLFGAHPTLADLALAPTLYFRQALAALLGGRAPLDAVPRVAAWWDRVRADPDWHVELAQIAKGLSGLASANGHDASRLDGLLG